MIKKLFVIFVAIIAVVIGVAILALQTAPVQRAIGQIAARYLEEATGEPVEVGRVAMPLPFRFAVESARIGEVEAEAIEFSLAAAPLLAGEIEITRLHVGRVIVSGEPLEVAGSVRIDEDLSAVLRITPLERNWGSFLVRVRREGETEQIYLTGRTLQPVGAVRSVELHLFGKPPFWQGDFTAHVRDELIQGVIHAKPEEILLLADTPWSEVRARLAGQAFSVAMPGLSLDLTGTIADGKLEASAPMLNAGPFGAEGINLSLSEEELQVGAERFFYSYAEFDALQFTTALAGEERPFSISWQTAGEEAHEARAEGQWQAADGSFTVELNTFDGVIFGEQIALEQPFTLSVGDGLHFTPLHLTAGAGRLELSETSFKAEAFPLTILELAYPRFGVEGTLEGTAYVEGQRGAIDLHWDDVRLKDPLVLNVQSVSGSLVGELKGERLDLEAHLNRATAKLSLPLRIEPFEIPADGQVSGVASFVGELGPLLQFVLPDTMQATGQVQAHVVVSGTAGAPQIKGELDIADGSLDDYYGGAQLRELSAHFSAKGPTVTLERLTAVDGREGRVAASGAIELDPSEDYPFELNFHLERAQIVNLDVAQARISGDVRLGGTLAEPKLTGQLTSDRVRLNLEQDLPPRVLTLDVRYINVPPSQRAELERQRLVSIGLDLELTIPRNAVMEGKGIKSEWKGQIRASGTVDSPLLGGELTLVKGDFDLAGRNFKLTQGVISFNGPPESATELDITATLELPDLEVNANLRGVIPNIELTFYSSPPLTQREILSYILFGGPTNELNAAQAIQLASASLKVAGGDFGPDLLSQFQKGIGLDILTITSPCPESDEYGILIGKRFGRDFEVHAYRSINQEYNVMRIELEIYRQIYLAGETGNEDGERFSLLWKRDY